MPPPAPDLVNDCWAALQAWLDTFTDGQTATLPAGSYRCDHRLRLNANFNLTGGGAGATLVRPPAYVGVMEAATAAPSTVTDSQAAWTTNQWTGFYINITSGARRGQFKKIQSNTATVLTTDSLGAAPVAGDSFQIISNSGAAIGDTTARNDGFIELVDRSDVTISNINLVGVLGFFFSNIIEGQHAFNLLGCQDCTIHDCTVVGVAGDGISENPGVVNQYCVGTTSYNNTFTNIGRQGYTITAATDITCYDSEWNFCGRSWIDIEPPSANQWAVASATDTTVTVNVVVTSGTVASATATSITASGVTWTPHQYANRYLRITSGAFAGTTLRAIDENTVNTLTFKNSGVIPAPGDTFDIQYEWLYEVGWFGKGVAESVFREVISVDGQSTFTFAEVNPDPPDPGTTFYVTKGGIARATFTDITLTAITNNVLASGNANGIFCDDVTLERVTVTDNKLVIGFGHTNRHPKRLTVKDCVGIGAYASGPAVLYVEGVTWHDNSAAYQNRDDAPTRFTGCTDVDFITSQLANIQMDLHVANWGPTMRVRAGTYSPVRLADIYDNIDVPNLNCGVYVAAGNTLYAELGETFTLADTNMAGAPTVIMEAGSTLGGYGTATVQTPLFGDVVVEDGTGLPAVVGTNLTSGNDSAGLDTTLVTASVAPTAGSLVCLFIGWSATTTRRPPTVTGCGLDWFLVDMQNANGSGGARSTAVYVAKGAAPTAGAITATFPYNTTGGSWLVDEFANVPVAATALECIDLVNVNRIHTGANTTDAEIGCLKPQSDNNMICAHFMAGAAGQTFAQDAADSGWTKLSEESPGAFLLSLSCFVRADGADLTPRVDWSPAVSSSWTCTVMEIKGSGEPTTTYPLDAHPIAAGQFLDTTSRSSYVSGWTPLTDLVVTNASDLVTSGNGGGGGVNLPHVIRGLDDTYVGRAITGTNITGGTTVLDWLETTELGTLQMSAAGGPGSGTSANAVVAARRATFVAGRAYLFIVANGRTGAPSSPTGVALTTGGAFTLIPGAEVTYNTDRRLSVWKFECTSTVTDTITTTFSANQTLGMIGHIVEITGASAGVVTANVVTGTAAAATGLPLTMGAYAQPSNGVVYALGTALAPQTGRPVAGLVPFGSASGGGSSVALTTMFARHNVATPDAIFPSSTTGAIAVEISAGEVAVNASPAVPAVPLTMTVPQVTATVDSPTTVGHLRHSFARGGDGWPG